MAPIRILHVLGQLNLGGAESRIMDLYRAIDRDKIQFDLLFTLIRNAISMTKFWHLADISIISQGLKYIISFHTRKPGKNYSADIMIGN